MVEVNLIDIATDYGNMMTRSQIQTGENHVHQGLSKVFVLYTYSTKVALKHLKTYSVDLPNRPKYLGYFKIALIECP